MSSVVREAPKNILVRAPNWIGDQILAYPFFYALRQLYPRARIVSACVPWVQDAQFRDLVDQVIPLPKPARKGIRSRFEILEEGCRVLRKEGPWDLGICLPNSFSSAWQIFRAGAKIRRGYGTDGRSVLLNSRVRWKEGMSLHRTEAYLGLLPEGASLESLGWEREGTEFWGIPPENDLDPGVPGVLDRFRGEKAWLTSEASLPSEWVNGKYWVLAPGTTAESRRWPEERFAELAKLIHRNTGWLGVVVGGVSEAALAERLCEDFSRGLKDWTAQGPVSQLYRVFQNAQFTVSNDSGLAHVAALCGSPVFIAWGAGNPGRTRPIGPGKVHTFFQPVDCWPCERNSCLRTGGVRLECLTSIAPTTLWTAIEKEILGGSSEQDAH